MRKAYTVIFKNTDKCKKGKILSVMIVYHEGCVNYLLLFTKLPHKLVAKSKHYYLMLYMIQEFGRALAECFWFKIFHEIGSQGVSRL